jgi:hypothetical protein
MLSEVKLFTDPYTGNIIFIAIKYVFYNLFKF